MEKLKFREYGLEELSNKELRETEGGWWFQLIVLAVMIYIWIKD